MRRLSPRNAVSHSPSHFFCVYDRCRLLIPLFMNTFYLKILRWRHLQRTPLYWDGSCGNSAVMRRLNPISCVKFIHSFRHVYLLSASIALKFVFFASPSYHFDHKSARLMGRVFGFSFFFFSCRLHSTELLKVVRLFKMAGRRVDASEAFKDVTLAAWLTM